jgi:hypothetical protein
MFLIPKKMMSLFNNNTSKSKPIILSELDPEFVKIMLEIQFMSILAT